MFLHYFHIAYWRSEQKWDALKKFATLRLFVETMPIYKAVASGNGNIEFYRETTRSDLNARQNLNYYDLPDPPHFSLPSTFKKKKSWA
jgi:hypothetical protein